MEYTTLWQPLMIIWFSFAIGAFIGALIMFYRMYNENETYLQQAEILRKKLDKRSKLADEISFKLLATKKHPDYKWLKEKLK